MSCKTPNSAPNSATDASPVDHRILYVSANNEDNADNASEASAYKHIWKKAREVHDASLIGKYVMVQPPTFPNLHHLTPWRPRNIWLAQILDNPSALGEYRMPSGCKTEGLLGEEDTLIGHWVEPQRGNHDMMTFRWNVQNKGKPAEEQWLEYDANKDWLNNQLAKVAADAEHVEVPDTKSSCIWPFCDPVE